MLSSDPKRLRFLGIDVRPRWRRRTMVVLTYLVYEAAMILGGRIQGSPRGHVIEWAATFCVLIFSICGLFSPLKSFDEPRPPAAGRLWYGWKDTVVLGSLDDWAKYRYGNAFDQISEQEQHELLKTYRVGNYLMPYKGASGFDPRVPDEREMAERNLALSQSLKVVVGLLAFEAAESIWVRSSGYAFLELLVLAMTAPKAILLWNEADPREGAGLPEDAE